MYIYIIKQDRGKWERFTTPSDIWWRCVYTYIYNNTTHLDVYRSVLCLNGGDTHTHIYTKYTKYVCTMATKFVGQQKQRHKGGIPEGGPTPQHRDTTIYTKYTKSVCTIPCEVWTVAIIFLIE